MSSFRQFILEGVLDPVVKELNPKVWPNGKLDPSIKNFIVNNFYSWLKENSIDKSKVKSINLLGSIAGFQYGKNSDFDVNVVLDLPEEELRPLRKHLPNGKKPEGFDYPVNYFVVKEWQDTWEQEKHGVYDIEKEKWMKEPEPITDNPFDGHRAVEETSRFFIAGIVNTIAEFKADVEAYESYQQYLDKAEISDDIDEIRFTSKAKLQEILDDLSSLKIAKHLLKSLRDEAFGKDADPLDLRMDIKAVKGNSSLNNLIYKYVEKLGYLEKIQIALDTKDHWEEEMEKYK